MQHTCHSPAHMPMLAMAVPRRRHCALSAQLLHRVSQTVRLSCETVPVTHAGTCCSVMPPCSSRPAPQPLLFCCSALPGCVSTLASPLSGVWDRLGEQHVANGTRLDECTSAVLLQEPCAEGGGCLPGAGQRGQPRGGALRGEQTRLLCTEVVAWLSAWFEGLLWFESPRETRNQAKSSGEFVLWKSFEGPVHWTLLPRDTNIKLISVALAAAGSGCDGSAAARGCPSAAGAARRPVRSLRGGRFRLQRARRRRRRGGAAARRRRGFRVRGGSPAAQRRSGGPLSLG